MRPFGRRSATEDKPLAAPATKVKGEVVRYELPLLGALNFLLGNALGAGVPRSLALDAHGTSMSIALLDIDVDFLPE